MKNKKLVKNIKFNRLAACKIEIYTLTLHARCAKSSSIIFLSPLRKVSIKSYYEMYKLIFY